MNRFEATALALALAIKANEPVIIWDDPGSGKSSYLRALALAFDLPIEVVIAALREPSDFAGLPVIRPDGVSLEPPAWARRLAKAGRGILCLDECSTAPPAVQAALLRVIQERVVGDLVLPPDIAIVAIANPPKSAAGGWDLTPPAANRFVHLSWQMDSTTWAEGMRSGFKNFAIMPTVPEKWAENIPRAVVEITGFIQMARPDYLRIMPKDAASAGKAFPTPRTWDKAARLLAISEATLGTAELDVKAQLIGGAVGEGPALEFLTWRRKLDLPNPEELLKDPSSFKLTGQDDKDFTIMTSVVAAFGSRPTPKRWDSAWKVLSAAVAAKKPDLAAAAGKALLDLRPGSDYIINDSVATLGPILRKAGILK